MKILSQLINSNIIVINIYILFKYESNAKKKEHLNLYYEILSDLETFS